MQAGLTLLVCAAFTGGTFLNLNYHWKQVPIPKGLTFAHILLAVSGVALLLPVAF